MPPSLGRRARRIGVMCGTSPSLLAWSNHGSDVDLLRIFVCEGFVSVGVEEGVACLALLSSSALRRYSLLGSTGSEFVRSRGGMVAFEVGVDGG